ncbi:MAG: aldehyde dehydrogenase family protein [Candidatus Pacebacteria bacterium]|nr:aldehyde dehydrogenase family protein [Candidatus Paceibacterota bacterium]
MTDKNTLLAEINQTGTLKSLPRWQFINGKKQAPHSGRFLETIDPGSGRVFAEFPDGDAADVDAAVAAANASLQGVWGRTSPAERSRILLAIAAMVREHADELAVVESLDAGKRLSEAEWDIRSVVRTLEYYAGAADKLHGISFPLSSDYSGHTVLEPAGVSAQIIPWNYPISTLARGIAPALAAGCAVVAKPAEQTPLTALMLADLAHRAGLPDGVFNVVTGTGAKTGAPLVSHPGIHQITFTGSVATGQRIMQAAAENITRLVLELGGKSPLVVLKDAAMDSALNGVMGAIFENAGQICSAGSRLIIESSIRDQFLDRLVARARGLKLGHGLLSLDMGPVNSAAHLSKIAAMVDESRRKNTILCGGKVTDSAAQIDYDSRQGAGKNSKGYFFEPTIILAPDASDAIVQEEIFGPVLVVQEAQDFDHAVKLANGTNFALAAGIYSADSRKTHQFARQVDAGQVYVNEYFAGGIETPFGGNRRSGFGREKGMEALQNYCKIKSIVTRIG